MKMPEDWKPERQEIWLEFPWGQKRKFYVPDWSNWDRFLRLTGQKANDA